MIKKKHDDILTIILRSTFLTDWAGSWMPSRTHGLSCRLRFIWLRFLVNILTKDVLSILWQRCFVSTIILILTKTSYWRASLFRHNLIWPGQGRTISQSHDLTFSSGISGQARQAAGSSRDPGVWHWHRHHRGAAKGLPQYNTQRFCFKSSTTEYQSWTTSKE